MNVMHDDKTKGGLGVRKSQQGSDRKWVDKRKELTMAAVNIVKMRSFSQGSRSRCAGQTRNEKRSGWFVNGIMSGNTITNLCKRSFKQ
ncbi:hypothetical protein V1477_018076 [Vespula maculifrons]|uniref:Uncharacterized protein n=1 Tax=Vespula maculifrons TaxID=7453 RepID=A0ABD2B120_VESMC